MGTETQGVGNQHRDRLLEAAVGLLAFVDAKMGNRFVWQQKFHEEARNFCDAYALRTPTDAEAAVQRVHMLLENCGPLVMKDAVLDAIDPNGSWRVS
jgi:hypothetical protein